MKKLLIILALLLTGCQNNLSFKPIPYTDTLLYKNYTQGCGYVTGEKGVYVVYGALKLKGSSLKAGQCLLTNPFGTYNYCIKELLDKYPELDCPEAQEAVKWQHESNTRNS